MSLGSIDNEANRERARFVARVMKAFDVDILLMMETGSDVSQAIQAIKEELGNSSFFNLVTDPTHATPTLRDTYGLDQSHLKVTIPKINALCNLVDWFDIKNVTSLRLATNGHILATEILADMHELEKSWFWEKLELGKDDQSVLLDKCCGWLRRLNTGIDNDGKEISKNLQEAVDGAYKLLNACNCGQLAESLEKLREVRKEELVKEIPTLRNHLELFETLFLIKCLSGLNPKSNELDKLMNALLATDRDLRTPGAICLLLLMGKFSLHIKDDKQVQEIQEDELAQLYYKSLAALGKADYHFETYAVLMKMTVEQAERLFTEDNSPSIVRFDEATGNLLATQQPGTATNWRSACKMRYPVFPNPKEQDVDLDVYLFHAPFTGSSATAKGKKKLNEASTLKMRHDSVKAIAAHAEKSDNSCILMGDFNIPKSRSYKIFEELNNGMEKLGFRRFPGNFHCTSLKIGSNILKVEKIDDIYHEPYDGAFVRGLDNSVELCEALTIDKIFEKLDGSLEKFDLMAKRITSECNRLKTRLIELEGADGLDHADVEKIKRLAEALPGNGNTFKAPDPGSSSEPKNSVDDLPNPETFGEDYGDSVKKLVLMLKNLVTDVERRRAFAYRSVISDHIPILLTLNLDKWPTSDPQKSQK